MHKQKCVFLDRDGVLNREMGDYTYKLDAFEVMPGVPEALVLLKEEGFLLIVITNQAGIAKGIYSRHEVLACHQKLQEQCHAMIDAIYFAPGHQTISESLSRKPDSLMLERAMAKYNIDPTLSWMVGDSPRDMVAGEKAGVQTILVGEHHAAGAHSLQAPDLLAAVGIILEKTKKPTQ